MRNRMEIKQRFCLIKSLLLTHKQEVSKNQQLTDQLCDPIIRKLKRKT